MESERYTEHNDGASDEEIAAHGRHRLMRTPAGGLYILPALRGPDAVGVIGLLFQLERRLVDVTKRAESAEAEAYERCLQGDEDVRRLIDLGTALGKAKDRIAELEAQLASGAAKEPERSMRWIVRQFIFTSTYLTENGSWSTDVLKARQFDLVDEAFRIAAQDTSSRTVCAIEDGPEGPILYTMDELLRRAERTATALDDAPTHVPTGDDPPERLCLQLLESLGELANGNPDGAEQLRVIAAEEARAAGVDADQVLQYHKVIADRILVVNAAEAGELLYENTLEALVGIVDGELDAAEERFRSSKAAASGAGIETRWAVGYFRGIAGRINSLRRECDELRKDRDHALKRLDEELDRANACVEQGLRGASDEAICAEFERRYPGVSAVAIDSAAKPRAGFAFRSAEGWRSERGFDDCRTYEPRTSFYAALTRAQQIANPGGARSDHGQVAECCAPSLDETHPHQNGSASVAAAQSEVL